MGKFARMLANEVSITDEGIYGLEGSVDSLEVFGGGGKGGATTVATPVYTPPPAAPSVEAATMDLAAQDEASKKKQQKAMKEGAKSLQIDLGTAGDTGATAVGTGTTPTA